MEILHRGILPEEKIYTAACMNCMTQVRFEQREGRITRERHRGDFVIVTCPVCGKSIYCEL
jgi:hypothetical protein